MNYEVNPTNTGSVVISQVIHQIDFSKLDPYKNHVLKENFEMAYGLVQPPYNWKPPTFSFELTQQYDSQYFHRDIPEIKRYNILNPEKQPILHSNECNRTDQPNVPHSGPLFWHPHSHLCRCEAHSSPITKSWFYTNWLLLDYLTNLELLVRYHFLPPKYLSNHW